MVAAPDKPSEAALQGLKSRFSAPAAPPPKDWREQLEAAMKQLGRPALDDGSEEDAVRKFAMGCNGWTIFPRDVQRAMVGMAVTRLRRLQDDRQHDDLDDYFSLLTAFSKREQPGYVNGLSRTHRPEGESWLRDYEGYAEIAREPLADAPKPNQDRLLHELERVAAELDADLEAEVRAAVESQFVRQVKDALEGGVSAKHPRLAHLCASRAALLDGQEFRNLRRSIRGLESEDEEDTEDERPAVIPADWAWWGRTRGRRGLIIGGDPREPNRKRLEQAFEFASLDWLPTEFRRNTLQVARDRVRAGGIDVLVILRRFVGHDCDEVLIPAAKEHAVDWVHLDKGYGAVRLKAAVERYLEPKP